MLLDDELAWDVLVPSGTLADDLGLFLKNFWTDFLKLSSEKFCNLKRIVAASFIADIKFSNLTRAIFGCPSGVLKLKENLEKI